MHEGGGENFLEGEGERDDTQRVSMRRRHLRRACMRCVPAMDFSPH